MRTTKSFSFDAQDIKWVRRMERDARRQSPGASNSKHLVHIIQYYFNHQKLLRSLALATAENATNASASRVTEEGECADGA